MKLLIYFILFPLAGAIAQEPLNDTIDYSLVYNHGNVMYIREKQNIDAKELATVKSRDSVLIVDYDGGKYLKVRSAVDKTIQGYLYIDFFQYDAKAVDIINRHPKNQSNGKKIKMLPLPKEDKYQQTDYSNSRNNTSPNTGSYSQSKAIHTGPRGGQYYINKNGNKTYVKKRK
ncbi:hypothetical protein KK083_02145 [Fulvivirgaceae bacterium PWU4]|uniref:SH3 domain-containing protein n=1 Tax=Chryseosolibacter histidini TaxID=2782349 RepID=A0AAP2DHF6_9BACT|nr:hypothetical protein [Chryseosolibacter histidini]MBT1695659.1 hypothetical protein [Chryseosolibacter histidini]